MANGIEEQYKNRTVNSCTVCWNTLRQSNLDKTSNQEYVIGSAKLCYFFTGEKLFTVTPILAYELIRWSNILYATVKTKKRVFSVSRLLRMRPTYSESLDHHRCADDTQLFFSFHPLNFDSNISHLQNAL